MESKTAVGYRKPPYLLQSMAVGLCFTRRTVGEFEFLKIKLHPKDHCPSERAICSDRLNSRLKVVECMSSLWGRLVVLGLDQEMLAVDHGVDHWACSLDARIVCLIKGRRP